MSGSRRGERDGIIVSMFGTGSPLAHTDFAARTSGAASPKVAIVIPVFNTAGTFLRDAVTSAAKQMIAVDVIVVDDGSANPDTLQTMADLASLSGVRLVRHHHNQGVAAAINTGFAAAEAPYVLVMGSDDILESTYAALAAQVLDKRPDVSIVTTDIQRFGASNSVDVASGAPNGVRDMLFHNVISGASVCRKSDWQEIGGYAPLKWGEDYEFWIRVLARGGVCVRLDTIQYRYRIHEGQVTQTLSAEEKLEDRLEIVRRNKDIWADHLDDVMARLWQQEEALVYFKRRYGPLNDIKSEVVAQARRARSRLRRRTS